MMAVSRIRPAAVVLLLALTLSLGAGCKKQRANMNQRKLADLLNAAESNNAANFTPEATEFQALRKQQQTIRQDYEGQKFDAAFESSRSALTQAQNFLQTVKGKNAAALQTRVAQDIAVAQANGGESIDPKRFALIQQLQEKGNQRYSKNDWNGAIDNFRRASQEVDNLLAPMKQETTTRLAQIRNRVREMEAEQVRAYAVNQGIQVDELLKQAEQLIDPQRQYKLAQSALSNTEVKINEAIEAAKEVRSQILLNQIEADLLVAMQKGAYVFYHDRLQSAAEAYENMLRDFEARRFNNVLQAGGLLGPRVATLRFETRKKSAETKIASLETMIRRLDEGGARTYLPGTVESLEAYLADARTQVATNKEDAFETSEQITQAASEEYTRILADFNELANKAIAQANTQLEIATEVFNATASMFDVKIPGRKATQTEEQMETNKQAMRADLQTLLDAAHVSLGTAQLKRDSQQYRDAIVQAEEVQKTAQQIQNETYNVAAHNSILEVQNAAAYYAGQGGSQYAPKQVAEVQRVLDDARAQLDAGNPKQAVDTAAMAKAQLDVLKLTLSERGAQNLQEADAAIRSAVETKALEYSASRMEEAKSRLDKAISARNLSDYKSVIENAANAKAMAQAAKTYSQNRFALDQIAQASSRLQKAAQADAPIYAPRLYKEASDKIAAAQQLVAGAKLQEAADTAKEAADLAERAAYERVIAAEKAIEDARHYNSWEYSSRTTADAINAAKEARRLGDLGQWDLARKYADEAIQYAKCASLVSKGSDVAVRLASLKADVDQGLQSGANYFQGDEVKMIIRRIGDLQASYSPENYEQVDAELRELEARLQEILINTPAVLERAVQEQTLRRQNLLKTPVDIETFAGDQLDASEKLLRYARIDFDKKNYSSSYENLRRAIALLDEVERMLASSAYNMQIADLFAEFVKAQNDFNQVLGLSETAMIQFAVNTATGQPQVVAIAGDLSPNQFRDRMETLYKRAKAITPPPFKRDVHATVLELFDLALRSSQNFEKLVILDQFDHKTAREIIHQGYEQMRRARDLQQQIIKTFREPNAQSVIVKKRQVAGMELY